MSANPVPIEHIVERITNQVMAAVKAKKGDIETRHRISAAIRIETRGLVLVGFDEAINATAARRREI